MKVREGGRIVNIACLLAVGVNSEGHREILGLDLATTEHSARWLAFLRSLVARGLSGVQLVISNDHTGLVDAIEITMAGASWQQCRTHYLANLLTKVPKSSGSMVATMVRTIFAQPDPDQVWAQHHRVVGHLTEAGLTDAADHLDQAVDEILTFTGFPKPHRRQIWSNNPQERLNKEIRRRTNVVGIFPTRESITRLAGALLAEQHDKWAITRRYMNLDSLTQTRTQLIKPDQLEEVTPALETATGQKDNNKTDAVSPIHHVAGRDRCHDWSTPSPKAPRLSKERQRVPRSSMMPRFSTPGTSRALEGVRVQNGSMGSPMTNKLRRHVDELFVQEMQRDRNRRRDDRVAHRSPATSLQYNLYGPLTDERIECSFGHRIATEDIGRAVEKRVAVHGVITYRGGEISRVLAESIEVLPEEDLPSADDVFGILAE